MRDFWGSLAALDHGFYYDDELGVRRARQDAKRLVAVLEPFCPPFSGFFLFYPSRAHLAPKLQAFVDFYRARRS